MARKKIKLKSRFHGHVHGSENFRQSIIRRVQNSKNFRGKRVSRFSENAFLLSRSHFFQFPFLLGDTKFSFTKKYQVKISVCGQNVDYFGTMWLEQPRNLSTKLRRRFALIWWLSLRRRYSIYLTNDMPLSCLSHAGLVCSLLSGDFTTSLKLLNQLGVL